MATNEVKPVTSITYRPDNSKVESWFADLKVKSKEDAADKSAWRARQAAIEPLRGLKTTEAILIARALEVSGAPIDKFVRDALVTLAKSYIYHRAVSAKVPRTISNAKLYRDTYRALVKDGETNITPYKLSYRAGTNNSRAAGRWLKSQGYTWKARPNGDDAKKATPKRAAAPARKKAKA